MRRKWFWKFFCESRVRWSTIDAIDKALEIQFPYDDPHKLEQISESFPHFTDGHMKGAAKTVELVHAFSPEPVATVT